MSRIQQTRVLWAALLAVAPARCADHSDWSRVESLLRRGDRVRVVHVDTTRVDGPVASISGAGIVVDARGLITIDKDKVLRIEKAGMSRKKKILIGAGAGLAAGAIVAATLSGRMNNEGFFSGPGGGAGTAASLGGGAAIGLAVGGLSGSGYRTIYQRKGIR